MKQIRVGQFKNLAVRVDFQAGQLLEPKREIPVAIREIVLPAIASPASQRCVLDSCEGEDVRFESTFVFPRRELTPIRN